MMGQLCGLTVKAARSYMADRAVQARTPWLEKHAGMYAQNSERKRWRRRITVCRLPMASAFSSCSHSLASTQALLKTTKPNKKMKDKLINGLLTAK